MLFLTIILVLCVQHSYSCTSTQEGSDVIAMCNRETLKSIPADVLDLTTDIQFASNRLTNLSYGGMLSRFFNLKVLNVSHNYLSDQSFSPDVFTKIRTLITLDLQRNRIRRVTPPLIRNSQMRTLKLDGNQINHVPADFLVNLVKLHELTLSSCNIHTISGHAFRSLGTHLKKLDLSNNLLVTLSLDLREDLFSEYLLEIRLYDNFWNCDCQLKWLRKEIATTPASWFFKGYSLLPLCEDPHPVKHRSWFEVSADKFGCPPQLFHPPPSVQPTLAYRAFEIGEDVTLTCLVNTYTLPHMVQWLKDDVSTDYKARLATTQQYNGSLLNTTLTIKNIRYEDYGHYKCIVNTTFGSLTQECHLAGPQPSEPASLGPLKNTGIIVAIVIVCIIVIVIVAIVATFYLKKYCVYRGKLYMGGATSHETSHKSDTELSLVEEQMREISSTTPLTVAYTAVEQTNVSKLYAEDELEALPADTEYPVDDAGCAEYNEYLEAVSSANHSPAFIDPATPHLPVYVDPVHSAPYVIDTNLMRTASPDHSNPSPSLANSNALLINRPNHIASYLDNHTSSSESGDSITEPIIVSRMGTTPNASPLTFIKEEPDEDEVVTDLL